MIDPEVKLDNIKKKIKIKLEAPNDGLAHFYPEDLKDLEVNGRELRDFLYILKNRNIIESIEEGDEDGLFELADGTLTHILDSPDEHPGIFIVKPTEEFIKESINEIGNNKIKIYIDKKHGIYLNENTKKPNYGIHSDADRFKIIIVLKKKKLLRGDQLYELIKGKKYIPIEKNDKATRASRAAVIAHGVSEINRIITKKLKINKKFILHSTTSGYTINIGEFDPIYR